MNKCKVVHLITKLELGGAQKNTIFTFLKLNKNLFDVFLMSGDGGILTADLKKSGGKNFTIVKNLVREISPINDYKAFRFLKREFARLRPDIVHTHSSKAGIIGRIAAKSAGVPFVLHSVHGFPFSPFQTFLKRNIYKMIEKAGSFFTDHYIFVAESDIETAKKSGFLKKAGYSLIRSGFDFRKFSGKGVDNSEVRKRYGIGEKTFICGTLAPFKSQKGLFDLIKIAEVVLKKDRDILFFIAGDGSLRNSIEKELEHLGIRDNFVMPGFIQDIGNVIPIFDIGLSTALWEGLPQSLVQLRLMKKAVIVTDIPGNREIIRNNENGYTENVGNIDGFAEKILFLKNNPRERMELANCNENLGDWEGEMMVKYQEKLYLTLTGDCKK